MIKALGLEKCRDTIIGDHLRRGVSGVCASRLGGHGPHTTHLPAKGALTHAGMCGCFRTLASVRTALLMESSVASFLPA